MKKIIVIAVVLILVLAYGGCTKEKVAPADNETTTEDSYDAAEEKEEPAEAAETSDESAETDSDSDSDTGILSPEFKKTMDDYEAWFDHYCDVMKRYKEDSTDLELLSEMTELMSEEATMFDEMENMDEDDMNTAELAYYLEVTARIEKKLLEVAE